MAYGWKSTNAERLWPASTVAVVVLLAALLAMLGVIQAAKVGRWLRNTSRPAGFPPGPPTLLGVGNLHQLVLSWSTLVSTSPESEAGNPVYLRFSTWAQQYGDILGLKLGTANLVVLSHPRHVYALLNRRRAIYSGRLHSHSAQQYVLHGGRKHIIFLQNNACHRHWRAAMHRHLVGPAAISRFLPVMDAVAAELARDLLQLHVTHPPTAGQATEQATATMTDGKHSNGQGFAGILRRWSLGSALAAVAGVRLSDWGGDEYAAYMFDMQQKWLEVLAPLSATSFVPLLRILPECIVPWKQKARQVREFMDKEYFSMLDAARRSIDNTEHSGTAIPCFLAGVLQNLAAEEVQERKETANVGSSDAGNTAPKPAPTEEANKTPEEQKYRFDDYDLAYMAGSLVDAAIDATTSAIMSLFLYLAAHPSALQKVHQELDSIVDGTTWPAPKVLMERIPYLKACIRETIRIRPPGPIALPHVLDQDDEYEGFHLPKGTIVIINAFGMQNDLRDFDDPDSFMPERFIQHPLGLKPGVDNSDNENDNNGKNSDGRRVSYTFGAGWRGCPGEAFFNASIAVAAARVFYAFDLKPLPGAPNYDLDVRTGFHAGITLGPRPFATLLVPRSDTHARWVTEEYERLSPVLETMSNKTAT